VVASLVDQAAGRVVRRKRIPRPLNAEMVSDGQVGTPAPNGAPVEDRRPDPAGEAARSRRAR
jgi:hypothetical protein